MKNVATAATSQNRNNRRRRLRFTAIASACSHPRRLENCRRTMISATIGVGVSVRPAVIPGGITAKDPKGIVQKNRYKSLFGGPIKAQTARSQKKTIGSTSK